MWPQTADVVGQAFSPSPFYRARCDPASVTALFLIDHVRLFQFYDKFMHCLLGAGELGRALSQLAGFGTLFGPAPHQTAHVTEYY